MHYKKIINIVLVVICGIFLSSCDSTEDKANTLTIYDGQFAEMKIMHQMVKLLVEDQTDLKVQIKNEMSPVNCFNELVKGNADLMNSYDGTLLTTFLHLDPSNVPEGVSLYDFANKTASEQKQVHLLSKLGLNNTYAVAVPKVIADKYHLSTVSDLIPIADKLTFGAEHEFFSEEGSAKFTPFITFYNLQFKDSKPIDIGLKYSAIESGNIDVTISYATDGLNKKAGLIILKDDRNFFPAYNGALLVRNDLFSRMAQTAPNLEEVLNKFNGQLTDVTMTELSYAVDVEGHSAEDVAREFLKKHKLIK